MSVRDQFSESDLEAIRRATIQAESRTAGELVCVIVERSDSYDDARWRAAALGAIIGGMAAAYGFYAIETWSPSFFLWPAVLPLVGVALGWLIAVAVPGIERELIGPESMRQRVHNRAAAAFVGEKISQTRGRTGVLIFLSLFEQRVEILCDQGIQALVPKEGWQEISGSLAGGMREGRAASALLEAIDDCGQLLEELGVDRPDDDVDDLANEPRFEDE